MRIEIPVSFGELIDKLTILEIKKSKITNNKKLKNVQLEFELLNKKYQTILNDTKELQVFYDALLKVNSKLWEIEDKIRILEKLDNKLIDFTRIDKSKLLFVKKIYGKQDDTPINYEEWMIFYKKVLDDIKPGLNVLLVHVGYDNDELKAITVDHPHWGSKWRELDFKILGSEEFRKRLRNRNIELVTWNQIKKVLYD